MTHRSRRSPKRAPFVVTVALAASAAAASAGCGGNVEGAGSGGSAGTAGSGGSGGFITNPPPPPATCPASVPSSGNFCPEVGLACEYDTYVNECGFKEGQEATCGDDGTWSVFWSGTSCDPPPPPIDECPTTEPTVGQWCNVVSTKYCDYPTTCCSATYQCVNEIWVDMSPTCNPPQLLCPETPPNQGDPCDACAFQVDNCNYDQCLSTGVILSAKCTNGSWQVAKALCK